MALNLPGIDGFVELGLHLHNHRNVLNDKQPPLTPHPKVTKCIYSYTAHVYTSSLTTGVSCGYFDVLFYFLILT